MKYQCKCGCMDMFTEKKGNNTGLYCSECGKFQKWMGKNELRVFEHDRKEKEVPRINGDLKIITNINLDIVNNLNEFINFLNKEIDKQLEREPLSIEDSISKCSYVHAYERVKESLINIVNGRRYNEYDM